MKPLPTIEFFSNKGPTTLLSGPWDRTYILDSQVASYLEDDQLCHQHPLSFIKNKLKQDDFLESVCPWYALYERTNQHNQPNLELFHTKALSLLGSNHSWNGSNKTLLMGVLNTLPAVCEPPLLAYSTMIQGLYRLNDAIESTSKLSTRDELLCNFLNTQSPLVEDTLGIGVVLGLRIAAQCPIAKGLLKIEKAKKEGYIKTSKNAAWDFIFLKTMHISNLPGAMGTRNKQVLVTADKHLRTLASTCKSVLSNPAKSKSEITLTIDVALPQNAKRYLRIVKPYLTR